MPPSCSSAPTGASCINAAVYYLDAARAGLGQPAYNLPADFPSLAPDQQALILSNLDRALYGLQPVTGLTSELDSYAQAGVLNDQDPIAGDPNFNYYTSNWAGAFTNMPLAYEAWMYDDGVGSGNEDCASSGAPGCWGHRHDVLWQFSGVSALAMGAASGIDHAGDHGYAMLLGGGSDYHPTYTYTWSQAQADGAGTNPYNPGTPSTGFGSTPSSTSHKLKITSLRVRGHHVVVHIAAPPDASLRCSLSPRVGGKWLRDHFVKCWSPSTSYAGVSRGHYRFRVRSKHRTLTRYFRVK